MSAQNVEIVRRWLNAFSDAVNGGSPDAHEALVAEFWAEDADYYPVPKFPEGPSHGRQQIARSSARMSEAWSSGYEHAINQMIAVGEDCVLACATMKAAGHASGLKLEGDVYSCVWLRNGRITRVEDHLTVKGALRALGVKGETLEAAGLQR